MPKLQIEGMNGVAVLLFIVCLLAGLAASQAVHQPWPVFSGALVGLYFLFAIKVGASGRRWRCCAWAATWDCAGRGCSTSSRSSTR